MAARITTLQSPFRAPTETPLVEKSGMMSWGWVQWIQIFAQQLKTPANQPVPASANSPGQAGQMAVGGGFYYIYDGTVNKWIKFAPVAF